jgi:hypothetical protein
MAIKDERYRITINTIHATQVKMIIRAYYIFLCQSDKVLYRQFILINEQLLSVRNSSFCILYFVLV